MGRKLKFVGHSDDVFCVYGTTGDEPNEIDCYDTEVVVEVAAGDEAVCVVGHYGPAGFGCWSVGLMPGDEDQQIPNWPMQWSLGDNGYSAELTLTAPDGATVRRVGRIE